MNNSTKIIKMKNQDYSCGFAANITAKEALDGINRVSKWWAKDFKGSSQKINDEFTIQYGDDVHYSKHKLIEVIPDNKIVWLVTASKFNWIEKNKAEWTNTKMVFEITSKADKTTLNFTHEGLVPDQECYSSCTQGWDMFIKERLFNFITNGKAI